MLRRPVHGGVSYFSDDPHWRNLIPFYEYFHGDGGAGIGASHQTGWTALVAKLMQQWSSHRARRRRGSVRFTGLNAADDAADVSAGALPARGPPARRTDSGAGDDGRF